MAAVSDLGLPLLEVLQPPDFGRDVGVVRLVAGMGHDGVSTDDAYGSLDQR